MIGLTADGSSDVLFGGLAWIRICALTWMHTMIWSFGHAWEVEALGVVLMPFFFGFLLVYSITGGLSTDLADPGYKVTTTISLAIFSLNPYIFIRTSFKSSHFIGLSISYDMKFLGLVELKSVCLRVFSFFIGLCLLGAISILVLKMSI